MGSIDAQVGDVPFERLMSIAVMPHRLYGKTVPKNRAECE